MFFDYLKRLIHSSWGVAGGISLALWLLTPLFQAWPIIPSYLASPILYSAIFVVSFVVAAYRVYQEQERLHRQYRETSPSLTFGFLVGSKIQSQIDIPIEVPSAPDLAALVSDERNRLLTEERLNEFPEPAPRPPGPGNSVPVMTWAIEHGARENYIKEVEDYLEGEFKEFHKKRHLDETISQLLHLVDFALKNNGGFSLTEVTIELQLPSRDVATLNEDKYKKARSRLSSDRRKPPKPPMIPSEEDAARPRPRLYSPLDSSFLRRPLPGMPPVFLWDWDISESDGGKLATFEIERVNPGYRETSIPPLRLLFGAIESGSDRNFEFKYRIFSAELRTPYTGTLSIRVRAT